MTDVADARDSAPASSRIAETSAMLKPSSPIAPA